ncbi:MAG: competence protein ComJ [Nitrospira sp.]|nr:competence protein ComJ [Nitrospira sp.]
MLVEFNMYFSYNQFMVSDETVKLPGCDWTDVHDKQGFARRLSTVSFLTILEFGTASVSVYLGPYVEREGYERVIAVPFFSPSGKVVIEGPENHPAPLEQRLRLQPGHYKLFAAQQVVDEDAELIELYFHWLDEPAEKSEILVADEELEPPETLLEKAEEMKL